MDKTSDYVIPTNLPLLKNKSNDLYPNKYSDVT